MKKLLFILFSTISINLFAEENPKLILEIYYTNQSDTLTINSLKNDYQFCCYFEVISCHSDTLSQVSIIKCSETGIVLGKIYGTPNKEFLISLTQNQLSPENVKSMVKRIKEVQNTKNYSIKE